MNDKINNQNDNMIKNIIGILLANPIYIIFLIILNTLKIKNFEETLLMPLIMYLPIIIGMILSYKHYKDKTSIPISISIFIFIILAMFFYFEAYIVEHSGWGGLLESLLWLLSTAICKVLTYVFCVKIIGWKKTLLFIAIEILCIASPFLLSLFT